MEKQNNHLTDTQIDVTKQSLLYSNQSVNVEQPIVSPNLPMSTESQSNDNVVFEQNSSPQTDLDDEAEDNKEEVNTTQVVDKFKHNLALIEAALYVAGRPLDINELCQVVGSRSKKKIKKYTESVIQAYAARNSPLEILALKDERYVLQVKADFTPIIKKLVNRPLLSSGPLKTLSYIAFRQPVTQKRVVEVRGQHAYGHVKLLKDMRLIVSERVGRSVGLKTTDHFADYFGLTQDTSSMKRELKRIFGSVSKDGGQP